MAYGVEGNGYYGEVVFHQCKFNAGPGFYQMSFSADNGFLFQEPCGGIKPVAPPTAGLKWNTDGNQLNMYLPDAYNGNAVLTIYDIEGREVCNKTAEVNAGNAVPVPVNMLAGGIYIRTGQFKRAVVANQSSNNEVIHKL